MTHFFTFVQKVARDMDMGSIKLPHCLSVPLKTSFKPPPPPFHT